KTSLTPHLNKISVFLFARAHCITHGISKSGNSMNCVISHTNNLRCFTCSQIESAFDQKDLAGMTTNDVDSITLNIVLSYVLGPFPSNPRGGLELLFANKRNFEFSLPKTFSESAQPSNINFLITQLCERELKNKRKDLFIKDGTV